MMQSSNTLKTGFDSTLAELLDSPDFLKYLPFALSALKASGVLRALREIARPAAVPTTHDNCLAAQAFEAQKSIGYNQCLDDLIYFMDRYLKTNKQKDAPALNYGANISVMEAGDLTKEELDAIIAGTDPNDIYNKLYAEHTRVATRTATGDDPQ
jgi:hypothetical protein